MKPIRKLVLKNLLMNKTRTIVTIIGIVLSVALITIIIGFIASGMSSVDSAKYSMTGDYEVRFTGIFNDESVSELKSNRNVKGVYSQTYIGTFKPEKSRSNRLPYVGVYGIDKATFEGSCCKLTEGRFPENDSEIIISSSYGRYITKGVKLNDEIELEQGERHYNKDYILENDPHISEETLKYVLETPIIGSVPYIEEAETFTSLGKKKFKVVGIMDYADGFLEYYGYDEAVVYTATDKVEADTLYVAFTDEGLKHFESSVSQITGIEESLVLNAATEKELEKQSEQLSKNTIGIQSMELNYSVLETKGIIPTTNLQGTLMGILIIALIILVVCGSCVFIIRNSFNISLNDKIKLFGMLSSIGTTPNQLRMSVFFEAAVLGAVGIPVGILLGYGITGGLMALANVLLKDIMGSFEIIFNIPFYAALISAAIGFGTVMMAAYNASVEASRVTPLEAIRSSKAVNIKKRRKGKRKEKDFKTPKFIAKIFGVGGSIAWKNMKRSRKQYRTTIISIVVSVALFITVSTFVDKLLMYTGETDMFKNRDYNIYITTNCSDINGKPKSISEMEKLGYDILGMGEVTKSRFALGILGTIHAELPMSDFSDELTGNPDASAMIIDPENEKNGTITVLLLAIDDESYASYCKKNDIDPEKNRDKGFLLNRYIYDNNYLSVKPEFDYLKDPVGKKIDFKWTSYYQVDEESLPEGYKNNPNVELQEIKYDPAEEYYDYDGEYYYEEPYTVYNVTEHIDLPITIGGLLENDFSMDTSGQKQPVLAVSFDWMQKNIIKQFNEKGLEIGSNYYYSSSFLINIDSSDPNAMEDKIKDSGIIDDLDYNWLINVHRQVSTMNSMMSLIQIIIYGFIIIISLIGITNIFNTITTNMSLRRKEFAMFRSIGMTKREFNRLIQLESMMYTMKSLLIGIPLGLLGCWGVNAIIDLDRNVSTGFVVPWMQIIISIFVVLALLWTIMKFSVSKVRKMNIIETIRNDNI